MKGDAKKARGVFNPYVNNRIPGYLFKIQLNDYLFLQSTMLMHFTR